MAERVNRNVHEFLMTITMTFEGERNSETKLLMKELEGSLKLQV